MSEHDAALADVRRALFGMQTRFGAMETRFAAMETRFAIVEQRLDAMLMILQQIADTQAGQ
jgi:hypothetical protein